MEQKSSTGRHLAPYWCRVKPHLAGVPANIWVVLGLFLIAAIAMAVHTAVSSPVASLHLKLQHGFRSAELSVWIDGDLVYSVHLSGVAKRRFGLIPDSVQGSVSQLIPVSAGKHAVRIRVAADDGGSVEDSTTGDFASYSERNLSVSVRRSTMSMNWQGTSATPGGGSSGNGWFSRYAGSLFMTIAGSIISALAGFAIRELPAHLRNRQTAEPKV
jgi:hypothetical protein